MRVHRSRPTSSVPSQCPGTPARLSRANTEPCAGSCAVDQRSGDRHEHDGAQDQDHRRASPCPGTRAAARFLQYACPSSAGAAPTAREPASGRACDIARISARSYRRIRGSTAACSTSTAMLMSTNKRGDGQDGRRQHRHVAPEDGEVHEPARARPVEHRLDQDGAAEQVAELQAHQRHDRGRGVLHDVHEHAPVEQALGAQGAHELLADDLAARSRAPAG